MARRVVHFPTIDPMYVLRQAARAKDQTGLKALASDVLAMGAALVGAWRAVDAERTGTDVTSWPAAFGGFPLVPFGLAAPQFDPATGTIGITRAEQQCFQADSAVLNGITDGFAVVLVMAPPDFSDTSEDMIVNVSVGVNATLMQLRTALDGDGGPNAIGFAASGAAWTPPFADWTGASGIKVFHAARAPVGAVQQVVTKLHRNARVEVDHSGMTTGTISRFTLFGGRTNVLPTQPEGPYPTISKVAAALLLQLPAEVGYPDALADRVTTWGETYAGAA